MKIGRAKKGTTAQLGFVLLMARQKKRQKNASKSTVAESDSVLRPRRNARDQTPETEPQDICALVLVKVAPPAPEPGRSDRRQATTASEEGHEHRPTVLRNKPASQKQPPQQYQDGLADKTASSEQCRDHSGGGC